MKSPQYKTYIGNVKAPTTVFLVDTKILGGKNNSHILLCTTWFYHNFRSKVSPFYWNVDTFRSIWRTPYGHPYDSNLTKCVVSIRHLLPTRIVVPPWFFSVIPSLWDWERTMVTPFFWVFLPFHRTGPVFRWITNFVLIFVSEPLWR